jgi:hypothetical protein
MNEALSAMCTVVIVDGEMCETQGELMDALGASDLVFDVLYTGNQSINRRPYAYQAPDGDIIIPVVGQTVMRAKPGSWIVKGALDEFCPFDAPGFVHLFEPVEDVKDWDVIVAEADRLGADP